MCRYLGRCDAHVTLHCAYVTVHLVRVTPYVTVHRARDATFGPDDAWVMVPAQPPDAAANGRADHAARAARAVARQDAIALQQLSQGTRNVVETITPAPSPHFH